ncbi:uncharacterized protein B0I36DRAFT_242551 [Microdochium trichocladiopsis]|uniref:Solute-binding protein family 5 domain-containing protein n=1 Tax=Microdochium trichocladiopsis TaxID=1682393 RepID=A0A9P9BMW6_9PEZI|nr:uncharacterized protein B0I36DRAFT_242551 [Microdochium trichocladiopsis]KAH7030646.1 hypothetical protein B0I36DRAFT_242551 [Microdochium trichocladiopsis]
MSTVRIALENVDFRLPTQVTDDNSVTALKSLVFEPLVRWQPGGLVKPGLLASWTHSDGGRVWDFQIRDDAYFHDGLVCDADQIVKYILGLLDSLDYFGMRWSYARYFAKSKITAASPQTVRIENPEPFADVLDILAEFWPSRLAADGKPVLGTGPYEVTAFERVDNIGSATMQRRRDGRASSVPPQHNGDGPEIIVAIHEGNGLKRLQLLREGAVEVALNLERVEDFAELDGLDDAGGSLVWGQITSTLSAMYYLNCPSGVFSHPEARLAANLAVDNEELVKQVFQGHAKASSTIVSPWHLGFAESGLSPIEYNPEKARQLLDGVFAANPSLERKLTLRTPVYMPEHAQKISAFVAAALERAGFDAGVEVKLETNRPEYARSIGLRKDIGDLALFDSTPNSTFRVLDDKVSSSSKNTWWLGYHDDETQGLVAEARKTITPEDRAKAYAKCLTRLAENPPWLYVAHPDVIWAVRKGAADVDVSRSGVLTIKAMI